MESKSEDVAVRRRSSTPRAAVKTTLNLSEDAVLQMNELALARNTTLAEVIRRAVALDKYLHDAAREGRRVLVEDADKTLTQLVFF